MWLKETYAPTVDQTQSKEKVTLLPKTVNDLAIVASDADTMEIFIGDIAKEKPTRFSPQELESFTRKYSKRLGSGGFGVVYKGKFPNGVQLAVKVLKNCATKELKEQFMAEVSTIGRTYHKNLVRLYGFCFDTNIKALVYEYMEKGSLDYILFDNNKSLEWEKLHEIAIGTAKGLGYLHHDCKDIIIHYDIKPGNVLLDSKFSPKVADFGLAMLYNREITHVSMTCGRGTPGYAAPELWMPSHITYKCDVYSYGITLFEIALGKMKLDATMSESQLPRKVWEKFERGELSDFLRDFGIKDRDRMKAVLFCTVALWCIQYLPEERPSMIRVVQMLEGMVEVMTPPNPFQHLISSGVNLAVSKQTTSGDSTRSAGIRRTSSKECTPIMKKYEIEIAS
ncbi:hypothetical protein GIB67_024066 [Kingdonia uniflora]|uniref:non-specific serine/threonine protein kinase n=1 Tax=Kingdonia uniflora TaxID=39325 RepID=A0A7J7LV13_9MAGN|nr:hypothetical protein GIB67_024066 [Kingdonia uniflora]